MDRPGDWDAVVAPQLGAVFGHYRLDALLGRGGMGVVFRATDLRLRRPVALKLMAIELAQDPALQARFRRESQLAASIEHPAILPIYDADTVDGIFYIAMRLASGGDLAHVLRREAPLDIPRTIAILGRVADALDAAHRQGLVHRDVKAGNILLDAQDGTELAYLADFGISRRLGGLTYPTTLAMAGSVDTISPEQITGGAVGGAADQYALGCVAYQCLTASPPFAADTEATVLFAHVNAPVPSVGMAHGSAIPSGAVPVVDAVLRRALAKSPGERYADCRTFVRALERAIAPVAQPATMAAGPRPSPGIRRPPEPLTALRNRRRWRPWAWVAAAVGGAVLVGGAILTLQPAAPRTGASGTIGPGSTATPVPTATPTARPTASTVEPSVAVPAVPPFASMTPQDLPGVIVFTGQGDKDAVTSLYSVDPDGSGLEPITTGPDPASMPAVSRDGRWLAYREGGNRNGDIWVIDRRSGERLPVTEDPADEADPAWSPEGDWLAFSRQGPDGWDVWRIPITDGAPSGEPEPLVSGPADERSPAWSPKGDVVAFVSEDPAGPRIQFVAADGSGDPTGLAGASPGDDTPAWLPDGRLLLTRRGVSGSGVYVVEDPLAAARFTAVADGGMTEDRATGSPDGSAFVYAFGMQPAEGIAELFLRPTAGGRPYPLSVESLLPRDPFWAGDG